MNVRSDVAVSAQQYFPTYQIPDESEIALKEYDLSAQGLAADQHGISVAAGLLVILAGGITTILGSENGGSFISALVFQASKQTEFLSYLAVFGLSIVAVRYLVELQKSATHGARKIIILRRLLGIDYGHIEKVLPSDRLEGANEPFAIAMFPGWGSTVSMAAVTVAAVSSYMMYGLAVGFVASRQSFSHYFVYSLEIKSMVFSTSLGIANFALMIIIYRRSLFEEWETHRFHLAKLLGNIMRLRLKRRMGHVLYRLELSVFEAKRLGINLGAFEKILVRIEDRRFYLHRGNSVSDAAKALVRKVKFKARGGGSTIPQQLCRSNFLSKIRRDFRR